MTAGAAQRERPRVGVFGIGLAAYWPQFEGLHERLARLPARASRRRLAELGADVVSAGLVDTRQGAREAGELLAAGRVDLVMLYTATYATSSQVLPGGAGGEGAGRDPQPAADAQRSTTRR